MKKPCEKCFNLRATLGWSARVQITERGSGEILATPYIDRLLNADFYPPDKRPEETLDDWPTCPDCGESLPIDEKEDLEFINLPDLDLTPAWLFIGAVILGLTLLLLIQ